MTINLIFSGAYCPEPQVMMLTVFMILGLHRATLEYISTLPHAYGTYPRAYYDLYKDPANNTSSINMLTYHSV